MKPHNLNGASNGTTSNVKKYSMIPAQSSFVKVVHCTGST